MAKTKTKLTQEEQERIKKLEDMMNAPFTERAVLESKRKALLYKSKEFFSIRGCLGVTWAWFYCLLGGREAGKSYAVTEFFVRQWKKYKIPFIWLRLNEASMKKMLVNNAEKLVDPDLYRKYGLELKVKGNNVYDHGEKMATVLALSTFANDKGVAHFDKDFLDQICPGGHKMYYHICLDEFQLEKTQRSQGDIAYQFVNQMENLVRSTKERMRIFLIGNTLEECSDILTMFNFIPENFGRYKLKSKRCYIDYMEPTDAYKARRKGTVGDLLAGNTSNFTNKVEFDKSLVVPGKRLTKPKAVIWFSNTVKFTLWEGDIISVWNREQCKQNWAMRPYIDLPYDQKLRDSVIQLYDNRAFYFHNLISQKKFQKELQIIKPRKQ